MKKKIFSISHLAAARDLFPEKIDAEWLSKQWTDEEINECKRKELMSFISNPSVQTYNSRFLQKNGHNNEELDLLIETLEKKFGYEKKGHVLTIGCANAELEFFLATSFPNLEFLVQDIAPNIRALDKLRRDLDIKNLLFVENLDSKKQFDIVFSMSVIYCIPECERIKFYEFLLSKLVSDGVLLVGCLGVLNPIDIFLNFPLLKDIKTGLGKIKRSLFKISVAESKMIGYSYSIRNIKNNLPKNIILDSIELLYFSRHIRISFLKFLFKVLGLSYTGYLLKIRKTT